MKKLTLFISLICGAFLLSAPQSFAQDESALKRSMMQRISSVDSLKLGLRVSGLSARSWSLGLFRVYSVSLGSIDGFPVEKPHMIGASKTGYHYPTRAALFC